MSDKLKNPNALKLNFNKAGMEGLNVEKINEIIHNASKGSKFYEHKLKCQQRIDEKITQMKHTMNNFSKEAISSSNKKMTELCSALENTRDLTRTIVHVDMDMFYAAVEMRDNPTLQEKPMAVGSSSMLSTSNYIARKFGVRAAMPGFIAKKLCPNLVIVPTNFEKYKKVSKEMQEIFYEYDTNFNPMSLDEAYLDITDYLNENGHKYLDTERNLCVAEKVVKEIREKIAEKTQLTASAGIASNTMLAKICSDMKKPNGQFFLPPCRDEILKFIEDLPIRKIPGIGDVSEQQLKAIGAVKCGDLYTNRGVIGLLFYEKSYTYFMHAALGLGLTEVSAGTEKDRKSISNETTFEPTSEPDVLNKICVERCKELAYDMEKDKILGKVFTLKIKTDAFQIMTRAQSLGQYTRNVNIMISTALKLLKNEVEIFERAGKVLKIRLLGARMADLIENTSENQKTVKDLFKSTNLKRNVDENPSDQKIRNSLTTHKNSNNSNAQNNCGNDKNSNNFNVQKNCGNDFQISTNVSKNLKNPVSEKVLVSVSKDASMKRMKRKLENATKSKTSKENSVKKSRKKRNSNVRVVSGNKSHRNIATKKEPKISFISKIASQTSPQNLSKSPEFSCSSYEREQSKHHNFFLDPDLTKIFENLSKKVKTSSAINENLNIVSEIDMHKSCKRRKSFLLEKPSEKNADNLPFRNNLHSPDSLNESILTFECPICDKICEDSQSLNSHIEVCCNRFENKNTFFSQFGNSVTKDLSYGVQDSNSTANFLPNQSTLHSKCDSALQVPFFNTQDSNNNYQSIQHCSDYLTPPNEKFVCPVCSKEEFSDERSLNTHIDTCLNKPLVRHLVQETNAHCSSNKKTISVYGVSNKKVRNRENKICSKTKSPSSLNTLRNYLISEQ